MSDIEEYATEYPFDTGYQWIEQIEAENDALRQRVEELELQVELLTPKAYEYKIEGGQTTSPLGFTFDDRTYDEFDGEGTA